MASCLLRETALPQQSEPALPHEASRTRVSKKESSSLVPTTVRRVPDLSPPALATAVWTQSVNTSCTHLRLEGATS